MNSKIAQKITKILKLRFKWFEKSSNRSVSINFMFLAPSIFLSGFRKLRENFWQFDILSNICEQVQNALVLLLASGLAEYVPESQRLVPSSCNDCFSVGAKCQIQNAIRMSSQFGDLCQRRIFPNQNLILRVTVCRDQFRWVFGPSEVANLWT